MGRTEKKIQRDIDFIKEYLDTINENKLDMNRENNVKKKNKLNKKIDDDIRMIILYIKEINKLGADISLLIGQCNEIQQKTLNEILPGGLSNDGMESQKKRNSIISRHKNKISKIQEAYQKYPAYDPNLPVKEKLENKIYKLEKSLGRDLFAESDKERSIYQPDWNYLEHMTASNEFTDEEREIMDRCYKIGEEYDSYWFGRFEQIGDAAQEWGNATQAKIWCKKMRKNTFAPFVKRLNPNIRTAEQLEYESKEMTKRYIEFMLSKEQHEPLVKKWNELYCDSRLERYNEDEKLDIIADAIAKVVGEEKAVFTGIFVTATQNVKDAIELIGNYTYEELGLE